MTTLNERNDYSMTVARRMSRLRKRRNWSQEHLAEMLAGLGHPIARSMIASMESGRVHGISVDRAFALASAFGLTLDQLLAKASCSACDDDPPAGFRCLDCGGARLSNQDAEAEG